MKNIAYPSQGKLYFVPNKLATIAAFLHKAYHELEKYDKNEQEKIIEAVEELKVAIKECKFIPIEMYLDGDFL